jgi:glycosyltransferase involved in cell wall biosynthesis
VIVGDGPERERVAAALPNAIFEGHQTGSDLATAYASSDVFLFPSDTETFGNVTLEALSSGLPAVVANATGSNALVQDGYNGFLATPRDSRDFLEKTDKLVRDSALRSKMSLNARQSAESYDWEMVLGRMTSYYSEL